MGAKLVRLRRPGGDARRPARRRDTGETRLWHFGAALGTGVATAVVGLAGLSWLTWMLLHRPRLPRPGSISLHDAVGVLQLVFASVAGAGALVALIVAYRRQKVAEADSAHDRTRVFNERFTAIASQLGDAQPAVRLAGVHAMAGLADDWQAHRQTCIDVLCAYLRMPYEPDPGDQAPVEKRLAFRASREVRHTVIPVIAAHLNGTAAVSWQDMNFDFTGVIFDGGSFGEARFSGGTVDFRGAGFSGGAVDFRGARFSGGTVTFRGAEFSGGAVDFRGARFSGDTVTFGGARFSGSTVTLYLAEFPGGTVSFSEAEFSGGAVDLRGAEFSGGTIYFLGARFSGGMVSFLGARFSGGTVNFRRARFCGGTVSFLEAKFSGCAVDFTDPGDWSHPPEFTPRFDPATPPPGIMLPAAAGPGTGCSGTAS